jgi:hypothetical protein
MRATIVRRSDLDILSAQPAVRLLVLDAHVREMHLLIEVRQAVFACPFANLVRRPIGPSAVVVIVFVTSVQPTLVLPLQLMIQDNAIDAGATLENPRLGLFVGAVNLDVVLQFPRPYEARVERLMTFPGRVSALLEKAATFLGQHHCMVAVAGHADGLDQTLLSEVSKVARTRIGRSIVLVPEITTGDHSKGSNGGQRPRF